MLLDLDEAFNANEAARVVHQWVGTAGLLGYSALARLAHEVQALLLERPLDTLLNRTIRPKIRARFGGRLKALVSGGAPLNPEVGVFFQSLGITFLQGYGQTEAAPLISCNRPRVGIRLDTVGPPVKGCEVRIADDGEIMVRGENVMKGYWRNPEETARVLRDGWLATGDIGHFDAKGRLKITDRKKDILVNDKGDNVSPERSPPEASASPRSAAARHCRPCR